MALLLIEAFLACQKSSSRTDIAAQILENVKWPTVLDVPDSAVLETVFQDNQAALLMPGGGRDQTLRGTLLYIPLPRNSGLFPDAV